MAKTRKHYWQYLTSNEGMPPPSDTVINIYLKGTNTPMEIFSSPTTIYPNTPVGRVIPKTNGYFEFWVQMENDPNSIVPPFDHPPTTRGKIEWVSSKGSGFIDDIDVLPSIIGAQGPQGLVGFNGHQGPQGFQGPQGDTGPDFITGPQGYSPPTGPQGYQGFQGHQGPQGPTGVTGSINPDKGYRGDEGPQGVTGAQGATGYQGPTGYTNLRGSQGAQGSQGDLGNIGSQGFNASSDNRISQGLGVADTPMNSHGTVLMTSETFNVGEGEAFFIMATLTANIRYIQSYGIYLVTSSQSKLIHFIPDFMPPHTEGSEISTRSFCHSYALESQFYNQSLKFEFRVYSPNDAMSLSSYNRTSDGCVFNVFHIGQGHHGVYPV
jgi:hypothetical protein